MTDKTTVFNVALSCEGCSKSVTAVLKKVEGVKHINCDVQSKKVTVTHAESVDADTLLAAIKKSGKAASLASA